MLCNGAGNRKSGNVVLTYLAQRHIVQQKGGLAVHFALTGIHQKSKTAIRDLALEHLPGHGSQILTDGKHATQGALPQHARGGARFGSMEYNKDQESNELLG